MDKDILFVNTTKVRENGTSNIDVLYAAGKAGEKKTTERGVVFAILFVLFLLLMLGVFHLAGLFPTENVILGTVVTDYPSWVVVASGFVAIIAGVICSSLWMRFRHGTNEGVAPEAAQNFAAYTYKITESGITAAHGGITEEIAFGDISQITANGYSYYVTAGGKKYQMGKNGFNGKSTEFEQFIRSKGFTIGIEP